MTKLRTAQVNLSPTGTLNIATATTSTLNVGHASAVVGVTGSTISLDGTLMINGVEYAPSAATYTFDTGLLLTGSNATINLADTDIFSSTGAASRVPVLNAAARLVSAGLDRAGTVTLGTISATSITLGHDTIPIELTGTVTVNGLPIDGIYTGGDGITLTGSDFDIDLTDTTIFSNAGVASRVPVLDVNSLVPASGIASAGTIAIDPNGASGIDFTHVPAAGPALYMSAGLNRLHIMAGNGSGQSEATELRLVASASGSAYDFYYTGSLGYKIAVDPGGIVTSTAGPSATVYGMVCSAGTIYTQCPSGSINSMNGGNLEFRSGTRIAKWQDYAAAVDRIRVQWPTDVAIASGAGDTTIGTFPLSGAAGGRPSTFQGVVHVWEAGGASQKWRFEVSFRPDGSTGTMVGTATIDSEGSALGTLAIDSTGGCRIQFTAVDLTNAKTGCVTLTEIR